MATRRVLIVRLGALGDVCHALPALDALRGSWPDAHLGWVVEPPLDDLLRGHPALDEVVPMPRKGWSRALGRGRLLAAGGGLGRFARGLRARGWHLALDLHANLRSAVVTWLSGAPRRVGFSPRVCREPGGIAYTRRVRVPPRTHKVRRHLTLLEALGVETVGARARVGPPDDGGASVRRVLRELDGPGPLVAVHPGISGFGSIKAWSTAGWRGLCRGLVEAGCRVALVAGPADEEEAARVREAVPAARTVAGLGLRELAAFSREVDLLCGLDSGPLHLAAVLGTPVLGIYGPKDPAVYGPWGQLDRVVQTDRFVPCMPCDLHRCPIDRRCMTSLDPDRVVEAALARLPDRAPPRERAAAGV